MYQAPDPTIILRPEPNSIYPDYLCFPLSLLKHMSREAAILLAFINRELHIRTNKAQQEDYYKGRDEFPEYSDPRIDLRTGWMPMSVKDILDAIGMSSESQTKYIKELCQLGLLEVKRKGLPAKRWLRLIASTEEVFGADPIEE